MQMQAHCVLGAFALRGGRRALVQYYISVLRKQAKQREKKLGKASGGGRAGGDKRGKVA